MKNYFLILISFFLLYINFLVFQSYRAELMFRSFMKSGSTYTYDQTVKLFPFFPNISSVAIPIDFYKAIVALREGKFYTGLDHIDLANKVNSTTQVANALKGEFFLQLGFPDSASVYLKKAFQGWPKNLNHYNLYNKSLAQLGDTLEIARTFSYIDSLVNKDARFYKSYITNISQAKLYHLKTEYDDLKNIEKSNLYGTWTRAYNFPNQEVVLDSTIMYNIDNESFTILPDKPYSYKLIKDSIFLFFKSSNKLISKYKIQYSDSFETLIFQNVKVGDGYQDQYFKKSDEH